MFHNHVNGNSVLHPSWDNDIWTLLAACSDPLFANKLFANPTCALPLWPDISFKVWLDESDPLLDTTVYVSTPFLHIASNFLHLSISQ